MTVTIYNAENHKIDHTKFGGIIYPSDFNPASTCGDIASRIESDKRFDEKCKKNILNRQKYGGNRNDERNHET